MMHLAVSDSLVPVMAVMSPGPGDTISHENTNRVS